VGIVFFMAQLPLIATRVSILRKLDSTVSEVNEIHPVTRIEQAIEG